MVSASDLLERWRSDLESWAIPPEILAATSESPWVLPRQLFARRAELSLASPSGPSFERAWEALATPGSVLDIGTGAGAACLPLAPRATAITAVDSDDRMLSVLADSAHRLGTDVRGICGRWPDVAGDVEPADVVTCHHVVYNVADLGPFVAELTAHARRLVVVEITARHPLTPLNPLWERFHGLARPNVPTADDALAVLDALGLAPSHELWSPRRESEYEAFEDLVEVTRRRLCLDPSRADEVASALLELGAERGRPADFTRPGMDLVTIWWSGRA
jgi:SAM-dependent methyltransferase